MGQWTEKKYEDGVCFVLHIDTKCYDSIQKYNKVDYIEFLDLIDEDTREKLLNKYMNKFYIDTV